MRTPFRPSTGALVLKLALLAVVAAPAAVRGDSLLERLAAATGQALEDAKTIRHHLLGVGGAVVKDATAKAEAALEEARQALLGAQAGALAAADGGSVADLLMATGQAVKEVRQQLRESTPDRLDSLAAQAEVAAQDAQLLTEYVRSVGGARLNEVAAKAATAREDVMVGLQAVSVAMGWDAINVAEAR